MLNLTTHSQIPLVCFDHLISLKAREAPSETSHMLRVKGDARLSQSFRQYLYHHLQSLYNHAANNCHVSHAEHESRKVDVGCFAFSPFPLLSLLPNAPYHKHLPSSTLMLPSHPRGAVGQWITGQDDQLPMAWVAGVCGCGLGSWRFGIRETVYPWDLAGAPASHCLCLL